MTSHLTEHGPSETLPLLTAAERNFRLTPEQAEFFRNHIRIRLVGTVHGDTTIADPQLRSMTAPSDLEYEGVKGEVDQLDADRGDVLFIEEPGHIERRVRILRPNMIRHPRHEEEWEAQVIRDLQIHPTLYYGAWLAYAREVPVLPADIDAARFAPFEAARARRTDAADEERLLGKAYHFGPHDDDLHDLREHLAAMTAINRGLAARPSIIASGQKPLYLVVWGAGHFDEEEAHSLPQVFRKMGVEPEVAVLPSSQGERMQKVKDYLTSKLTRTAISAALDDLLARLDATKR